MNSNLLFPLIPRMRSCRGWDICLYLVSNWSGFWLCIFSHLFKSQNSKSQAVCVDCLSLCPLLITISLSYPQQSGGYALWHRKSLWQRGHPSPTGCIYVYISVCFYSISPASPLPNSSPACFSHPSLSPPPLLSLLGPVGGHFLSPAANSKRPFSGLVQWMRTHLFSEV